MKALKDVKGFTLIELLVVVAIIGILAAIAIPQFAEYRQRGFDAQANSDLRNAATSEEAYFATEDAYKDCSTPCSELPAFSISSETEIQMTANTDDFNGTSESNKGTGKTFSYNSLTGGMS